MDSRSPDDRDRLELLRQRREELLELRFKLKGMLGDLDVLISEEEGRRSDEPAAPISTNQPPESDAAEEDLAEPQAKPSGRPLRAVLLDALEDIDWPAYSRELSQYCAAWTGRAIQPERFGSLANDEAKAFQRSLDGRRVRPVWLCFGLTHDRHQPIKRLWARSDWPLERRIMTPSSGRIQHLKLTAKLCELAQRPGAANPEMLAIMAADHARDLPGMRVRRGEFELENWRNISLTLLHELDARDEDIRRESAERLRHRGPFIQLFGVPDAEEIDDAASAKQQRKG